jgi:hypothetical protein
MPTRKSTQKLTPAQRKRLNATDQATLSTTDIGPTPPLVRATRAKIKARSRESK